MHASPRAFLGHLGTQILLSRCVAMMAELGIADLVAETPRTPDDLARVCGVNADALMRILRFLASHEIFSSDERGVIRNTPISELLRSTPGSLRDQVRSAWQDVIWDTYRQLPETLRTGAPAFDQAFGQSFFDYLATHPDIGARFDASMALMSMPENAALAAAYPFQGTVVDVGGDVADCSPRSCTRTAVSAASSSSNPPCCRTPRRSSWPSRWSAAASSRATSSRPSPETAMSTS